MAAAMSTIYEGPLAKYHALLLRSLDNLISAYLSLASIRGSHFDNKGQYVTANET